MKIVWRVYSVYVYLIFVCIGIPVVLLILLISLNRNWQQMALRINRFWSWLFFWMIFNPIRVEYKSQLKSNQRYIFCANHFSYLDIPVIARLKLPFKYIGKKSVSKIPIFGQMFSRLHIMVDRSSVKSRAESLIACRNALKAGFNLVVFPEGGIYSAELPKMTRFKDGAFRLSIEENIPIIPVTMPNNFLILPDDGTLLFKIGDCKMIVHEPIFPNQLDYDMERLKSMTYAVISNELHRHHPKKLDGLA